MSLGEIVLLLLVGIVVVGPRNLPSMMRTAGQWIARLRRMSTELRSQSGIDDLLRSEGLDEHLHQLRSLSRLNVVDTLMAGAGVGPGAGAGPRAPTSALAPAAARTPAMYPPPSPPETARSLEWKRNEPLREREYPLIGCDAGGALPDDATPYHPATPSAPPMPDAAPDAAPDPPALPPATEAAPVTSEKATEPAPEPPADVAPAAIEAPT